jgi:predicted RNase H-like HicB family nuclease
VKAYPIKVFYSEEDGGYIAEAPHFEGCSAFGETPSEALSELETAKALWLETARTEGIPIPEPNEQPAPKTYTSEEARRIADEWRQRLAGRAHSDSAELIREDRER